MKTKQKEKIELLIRKTIKEAIGIEMMKLRSLLLPFVSSKEQKEIEKKYGVRPDFKVAKRIKTNFN